MKTKLFLVFLMMIAMLNIASAEMSMIAQARVANQANFDLTITGSSLYGLELELPSNFIIVADPSNGVLGKDGKYRTTYGTNLILTIRAPDNDKPNDDIYYIKGKYTEGTGVKNFVDVKVAVYNGVDTLITCPVCPTSSPYSECSEGKQSKLTYRCDESTGFICVKEVQYQQCADTDKLTCDFGWICADDKTLALRQDDCSYKSTIQCKAGCDSTKNLCNPAPSDNLITGAVTGIGESKARLGIQQFFVNIINWLKGLFNFA